MEVSRQFSTAQPLSLKTPRSTVTLPQPQHFHSHVHMTDTNDRPLSLSSNTIGSVNTAAAWRAPNRVMPFSKATSGSTFNPYG